MSIEEIRFSFYHLIDSRDSPRYPAVYDRFYKVTVCFKDHQMTMWFNTDIYSSILKKLVHVDLDIISEAIEHRRSMMMGLGEFSIYPYPNMPYACVDMQKIQKELLSKLGMESVVITSFTNRPSE